LQSLPLYLSLQFYGGAFNFNKISNSKPYFTINNKLTGTANEMLQNTDHSTASLRPPYSCRSNHDSGFFPAVFAAADPAHDVSWSGLCLPVVAPPISEFPA